MLHGVFLHQGSLLFKTHPNHFSFKGINLLGFNVFKELTFTIENCIARRFLWSNLSLRSHQIIYRLIVVSPSVRPFLLVEVNIGLILSGLVLQLVGLHPPLGTKSVLETTTTDSHDLLYRVRVLVLRVYAPLTTLLINIPHSDGSFHLLQSIFAFFGILRPPDHLLQTPVHTVNPTVPPQLSTLIPKLSKGSSITCLIKWLILEPTWDCVSFTTPYSFLVSANCDRNLGDIYIFLWVLFFLCVQFYLLYRLHALHLQTLLA